MSGSCNPINCSLTGSRGFSRQEYWNGLPFPSPGDLPIPGIKPVSPALQADSLPIEPGEFRSGKQTFSYSSVLSLCHVWLSVIPWTAARQDSLSITNSQSILNSCPLSQWCHPTISLSGHPLLLLPSIFPCIRVFSNESVLHITWPKYWSFSFSISPSNEHQGLISFRMDWLDLLAVPGTLKSLLQHHSSKASILQCSAFFTVQLSHPYMTTGKPQP